MKPFNLPFAKVPSLPFPPRHRYLALSSLHQSQRTFSTVTPRSSNLPSLQSLQLSSRRHTRSVNDHPAFAAFNRSYASISASHGDFNTVVTTHNVKKVEKVDVKRVLVIGSGGLSIGQAGEFDYSGSQAIKALKESNIHTILLNPNIATIQTSQSLADTIYFLPVTPEYISHILEKERPDGILLTFGGQTALNCGIKLQQMGVLERLNVKVLGTPIRTLEVSEDRELFAMALKEIDIPVAQSTAVSTVDDALAAAENIGYPIIIRSAYALGGLGSGFANSELELRQMATSSLALSPQILVEKSMKGWKEVEYEVVRDAANNCITVCNMENFDPLGVHTGDSIVVAPSQTLSDEEYHMLRTAAIKIIRHLGVVGECNVQYALNPKSLEYKVIEVNARLSRSSALASKATGYPLAFVAAKIALGHTLPELSNAVTKTTTACFEPSLDYIVTKIPRWDLAKFNHVSRDIGSCMKSVGEVMAIGRTFEESLQKAVRMVDPGFQGFQSQEFDDLDQALAVPTDRRLFAVGSALLDKGYSVDKIHEITKIDKWFLYKLENIAQVQRAVANAATSDLSKFPAELLLKAKKTGFSDAQLATIINRGYAGTASRKTTEDAVRAIRKSHGIRPFVKRIDTLAAEFPAHTNYLYTTYNGSTHDVDFKDNGTLVLGSGVYRIGSSVEFDWCGVSAIRALRSLGIKTVMVNYNPETVSTDFDECDRLYFEELSYERVLDIYEQEKGTGCVVSVGGQLPQNMALRLHESGNVKVLGTSPVMIDSAEDRYKFSKIMDTIGVDQPEWKELTSVKAAEEFAATVGYPVLIRPSYVLSGAAMNVAHNDLELNRFLSAAADISPLHPVVVTKFIAGAQEIDIDSVAHNGTLLCHAVSEHVEHAGVHSGDATLILPSRELPKETMTKLKTIAEKVAAAFEITGPFNMQVIRQQASNQGPETLKVIECNLRASRSFPFVSKVLGVNFIDVATRALCNREVPAPVDLMAREYSYQAVKVPQFSWTRLAGADPFLGVEMASTGEVACFGRDKHEAYLSALQSTANFNLPTAGQSVLVGMDHLTNVEDFVHVVKKLATLGHKIVTDSEATPGLLSERGCSVRVAQFPFADKRALQTTFNEYGIDLVINLAREKPSTQLDSNYLMRRAAVDFGVPLMNDPRCARLFVDALELNRNEKRTSQNKSTVPPEVKSWEEFVSGEKVGQEGSTGAVSNRREEEDMFA